MKDIKNNDSYVMVENEKIIATIYISFEEDEDYKKIYEDIDYENVIDIRKEFYNIDIRLYNHEEEMYK